MGTLSPGPPVQLARPSPIRPPSPFYSYVKTLFLSPSPLASPRAGPPGVGGVCFGAGAGAGGWGWGWVLLGWTGLVLSGMDGPSASLPA